MNVPKNVKAGLLLVRERPGIAIAEMAQILFPQWQEKPRQRAWTCFLVASLMTKQRQKGLVFYRFLPDPFEGRPEPPKKCWYLTDKGYDFCEQLEPTSPSA